MAKIDSLEIELKTNAKEVVKDIDTLSKSVEKLSKIDTKTLYQNLNSISRVIKNFANDIKALDTSKLESMANSISKISGSTQKSMQQASKSVSELNKNMANTSGVKKSQQSYEEFMASIKGLGKNQKFFGTSTQLDTEIASTQNKIEKIRTSLEAYNQEGKSVETKGWRTAQRQLEQYSNYLDNLLAKQKETSSNPIGFKFDESAIAEHKNNIYNLLLTDEEYQKKRQEILSKMPKVEIPAEVNFDTSKGLERFKEAIKKTGGYHLDTSNIDGFMDDYANKVNETRKKVDESVQSMANTMKRLTFEPTKIGQGQKYTEEYKMLENEISKAEKQLEKYLSTQERLDKVGVNTNSQRYKNLTENIDQTDAHLQRLYKDMQMLQSEGKDIINPNAFDNLSDKSSKAQSVMQSLTKALRTGGFGGAASTVQKLSANIGSLSSGLEMSGAAAETAGTAMAGLQTAIPVIGIILAAVTLLIKAFTSLAKVVINVAKKVGNGIKTIATGVKNLVSNILSIGSSSYQAKTAVGKFINKVVNMFKSRILRQAITKAIEYAKQGFKDLDAYSANIGSPFHRNVQTIIADLKWLGRSIAAAFEPIINVATPILDFLIDKIVTVINYINQFFAALTGKSTWTKATKGASDYGSAASGASKAQKDLNKQIREWDKLNVITNPNKDKGSGGSGASSGAGGGFTTEEVDNDVANFVKKMQDTWNTNADFTWLGNDIANKVKEKLDNIPWDGIKKSAEKFGKALATTINGFVEFPDIAQTIGNAIAQGINTVVTTFDSFVTNIHGNSIGAFIGNLVGTALDNIEWDKYIHGMGQLGQKLADAVNALANTDVLSKISKAFANVLKGAIEGAYKFVTDIKWDELGTKIGESISEFFKKMNEVDKDGMTGFQKLGKTVSGLATGLMDMISNALDSIEWDKVGQSVVDFLTSIDWLNVIGKAVTLKSKISNAFWELFNTAIKGIGQLNIDVSIKLLNKIKEKLTEAKEYLKDKAIDFAVSFPKWSDVSKKISNIVTNLKKKFKIDFKLQIPSWSSIKSKFDSIINGIKNLFKLDLSFKSNAKTQTVSTSIAGSVIEKAVKKITKKVTKKANGGIYSNGTWKQLAVGGFPSHGTQFVAGEHGAEVVGHINGRTEVLNKSQIAQAMMGAVANGNAEQNALLRQQNEYLRQLLMKDNSISYRDVFKATQKGASEYKTMTGNPAFI